MPDTTDESPSVIGERLFGSERLVFRLESLPAYLIEEEQPAFEAWRRGESVEWPRDVLDFVAATHDDIARGVEHIRIRVLPDPPTEYFKFECTFYPLLVSAGVSLLGIAEQRFRELVGGRVGDFYFFDSDRVVELLYDEHGRWLGERELIGADRDARVALAAQLTVESKPFVRVTR